MRRLTALVAAGLAAVHAAAAPNIVFILTDDQDLLLNSSLATPRVLELLRDEGATLENGFVSTPICCPSRTIDITGRYSHNNGYMNPPAHNCMNVDAEGNVFANQSLFHTMQRAGYFTAVVGKLTNDQDSYFCGSQRREGMDVVFTGCSFNDYFADTFFWANASGTGKYTLPNEPRVYQTAQLGNFTVDLIQSHFASSTAQPLFLWLGPHAPHFPAAPAPWDHDEFPGVTAPRTPSYNLSTTDHHAVMSGNPALNDIEAQYIDLHYRDRLRALLHVDRLVDSVLGALQAAGQLDNTYIFYTSDHGYHLGELNVPCSKQQPIETDVRVPFYVRGPGITAGSVVSSLVSNVDLLPTWYDLAGISAPQQVDGHSMVPLLQSAHPQRDEAAASWRTELAIEYLSVGTYYSDHCVMWSECNSTTTAASVDPFGPPCEQWEGTTVAAPRSNEQGRLWYVDSTQSNSWRALRVINGTQNLMFTEFDPTYTFNSTSIQFVELFDLDADPWSRVNLAKSASPSVLADLHNRLASYFACSGAACP